MKMFGKYLAKIGDWYSSKNHIYQIAQNSVLGKSGGIEGKLGNDVLEKARKGFTLIDLE